MNKSKRFALKAILCVCFLTLSIFFVGCSAKQGQQTKSAGPSTLRIANGTEIETMDPHIATGVPEHRVLLACFEGLMRYNPKTAESIPGVAKDYIVSPDGMTYTFHLRTDAKWSNGESVTADDFIFAFRRVVDPKTASQFVHLMHAVKNAKALNEGKMKDLTKLGVQSSGKWTLIVTLEEPTPFFIQLLPHYTYAPVPKKLLETVGDKWTKPKNILCNGPYRVDSVALQSKRQFKRNPHNCDGKSENSKSVAACGRRLSTWR